MSLPATLCYHLDGGIAIQARHIFFTAMYLLRMETQPMHFRHMLIKNGNVVVTVQAYGRPRAATELLTANA